MNQINRLYCAQSHFHERLGELIELPEFFDLKESMNEAISEMGGQIKNTDDLYSLYGSAHAFDSCSALLNSLENDFSLVPVNTDNILIRNLNLLSYIQNIQNVITAAFQFLMLYKVQMDRHKAEMVEKNFREMKLGKSLKLLLVQKVQFA